MEELVLVLLQFERMLVLELLPWYIGGPSPSPELVVGCPSPFPLVFIFLIGFYCLRFDVTIVCYFIRLIID